MEAAAVFDAKRPITINLRAPGGVKTVRVRFPSDEEWIGRQRRRKVLVKQLGRGVSETTVANSEDVDAELLGAHGKSHHVQGVAALPPAAFHICRNVVCH